MSTPIVPETPLPEIRKPAVAGSFYPAGAVELTKAVASLYAQVDKYPVAGRPIALVAPHAGYLYSGRIAAKAYKLLEGETVDTVVVVSPSHTVFFRGCSVYRGDGYATPLGVVPINREISDKLTTNNPSVYYSATGHASAGARGEHGLEVHLPFLQVALGKFNLVAIVMGDQEEDTVRSLGHLLGSALVGTKSLLVASSDLSHFHPEKDARKLDFTIQQQIQKYDPNELLDALEEGRCEACGGGAIAAVLIASRMLGGSRVEFLDYTTSAEVTGDFDEVVGYLSAAVIADRVVQTQTVPEVGLPAASGKDLVLDEASKRRLLQIARDAIAHALANRSYTLADTEGLTEKRGVFVTLLSGGELRGCIGTVRKRAPLCEAVTEMAVAAALDDPRFSELTGAELPDVQIEISVLSSLIRIHGPSEIVIGRDGLLLKLDTHSGLLLPQVASERNWTAVEFLEQVSLKAGLPKGSYKERHAELYRFTADVFSEPA